MRILKKIGKENLATVYIAELSGDKLIEFAESIQPPHPIENKWVIIISTLSGCPVKCNICDAGFFYKGKLSADEMLQQIDYLLNCKFPGGNIKTKILKIQFSRLGEPSLNMNVIDVLKDIPSRYPDINIIPSISSVAPYGREEFFNKMAGLRNTVYADRDFQMQFSIHTTDEKLRDKIIPVRKMSFSDIAELGNKMFIKGFRKIALNFALAVNSPIENNVLLKYFNPEIFLIKITPINPTYSKTRNKVDSYLSTDFEENNKKIREIREAGYDVIVSIGEPEENQIGSNCGQFIISHLKTSKKIKSGYSYV